MDAKVLFYEKLKDTIRCRVCPHNCMLDEGKFGICSVRTLKSNIPIAINYGEIASCGVDPIEKKPLYHFKPSKNILSVGTFGCNMTCTFCQNHEISQNRPQTEYISTDKLISIINEVENNAGIAFTYNEPFMWYEYIYDVAKSIKEANPNTSVVIVTNGYINEEPLMKLLPYVDAMNIDLKSYSNSYYKDLCGGSLKPVLKSIEIAAQKCHVEITTLLVSGENDSLEEVEEIARFLSSINKDIPLHLSRYFPRYKLMNSPTDITFMRKAEEVASKYLNRVILGNV